MVSLQAVNVKKFQKRLEDFVCEKCEKKVRGSGYTNHCPFCLWSKHVDIFPGDRLEPCQSLMRPIGVIVKGDANILLHECIKCGYRIKNKVSTEDDFDKVIEISKKPIIDK